MDTTRSLFYDDREWTPPRWNAERYVAKIEALARVIDALAPNIIGLSEVENEAVVRDLVVASKGGYNYIHRTSSDGRGIDLALLYNGDRFFPHRTELVNSGFGREFLHISGTLDADTIALLVVHLPSQLNENHIRKKVMERLGIVADSLQHITPRLIVMGDFNATPTDKIERQVMDARTLFLGIMSDIGSYAYRGRWQLFDQIWLSQTLRDSYSEGGVFVRGYMLIGEGSRRGYPLRTFYGTRYTGGASDHLPVFVKLKI